MAICSTKTPIPYKGTTIAMLFTPITELNPQKINVVIRVRVIRKLEFRGATNDGPLRHINLILADEQLTLLRISDVYTLQHTTYYTHFANTYYITHAGYNNSSIVKDIFIKDISDASLKITLWGDQASGFSIDNVCNQSNNKSIVIMFVGCLAKQFKGQSYLSGTTTTTWYFNPNIPEAQEYYINHKGLNAPPLYHDSYKITNGGFQLAPNAENLCLKPPLDTAAHHVVVQT
ncbi:hypothetical protein ZEAMMB73_Zm00001d008349 [Zea mays]|uniref:Replication protein A OB domain-containing protein n=1 Tax=Zea mays TaxID=4577 RepID=A0A1D6FC48_MAIZE|nr:hypothetical protein ZEAMMB73_Zm00001d008349 [Zea mays]AQK89625.1 hypothetical protein ZEAMMB73_Zm00001d008349 [Zea mays]AQK89626.1 hypothetical protein ZEAMMB73_Zm00001d008349 [Zea mays]